MLEVNFEPFNELATPRLLLRKIVPEDAPALYELRTHEQVMQFIDKEPMKSLEEAKVLVERIIKDLEDNSGITWCISLPENKKQLIGTIGFWRLEKHNYRAEIGYMLHPQYWNKGFMQEAIKAVIEYGFKQMRLHSIMANINPGNIASAALLEKTNFVREAYFKEDYYFRGKFLDSAIYSLLNK